MVDSKVQRYVAFLVLFTLLSGMLFYAYFRQHAAPFVLSWLTYWFPNPSSDLLSNVPNFIHTSLPSFLHAFISALLLQLVIGTKHTSNNFVNVLFILFLVTLELVLGVFDVFDVAAIVLGCLLASVLYRTWQKPEPNARHYSHTKLLLVASLSGFLTTASYYGNSSYSECARFDGNVCVEYKDNASPIYMDYQTLRDAIQLEAPRPPDNLGRIYLYQDYLFLNEINQGIHIFDNQDTFNPTNLGFIRIPGNREVVIRDDYLYADSYVDLVTIGLSDLNTIQVLNRQENIFPYDAFQNIPDNISFSRYNIEPSNGVVIGYRLEGN